MASINTSNILLDVTSTSTSSPELQVPLLLSSDLPQISKPDSSWKHRAIRFSTLIPICAITCGVYYCYDLPGALTEPGLETWFDISPVKYELFYSLYAWPNTILAFCGGYLVDRVLGVRKGALLFSCLLLLGQLIFAFGTQWSLFWLACMGRFVFGLGGECIGVCQNAYCALWFKGRELALAMAITLSISRLASFLCFFLTPFWDINVATWIAVAPCVVSSLSCIILWPTERKAAKSGALSSTEPEEKPHLRDILHFPLALWGVFSIVVFYYISLIVFVTIASGFLQDKYGVSENRAGTLVGLPYLISVGVAPAFGFFVDFIGFHLTWVAFSAALLVTAHLLLAFAGTLLPAIFPMILIGISYSMLAAALWPSCIALLVSKKLVATAYGIAFSMNNTGLTLAPLAIGALLSATNQNYTYALSIFAGCAGVALLITIALIVYDWIKSGLLNTTPKVQQQRQKEAYPTALPFPEASKYTALSEQS